MFQYMFFYWLQQQTDDECVLDDLAFFGKNVPHNGYELERVFGIHAPRMSERFDADTWNTMVRARNEEGKSMPQLVRDFGIPLQVVLEQGVNTLKYDGDVLKQEKGKPVEIPEGDTYYWGYWLMKSYFREYESNLRRLFKFPALPKEDRHTTELIRMSRGATAIHVRRGDMAALGWSSPAEKFAERIQWMEENRRPQRYFLFSDDIPWCRANAKPLGLQEIDDRLVIIEGHAGVQAYIDMQLMALCVNRISDHSSFSMLAGLLCTAPAACELSSWALKDPEYTIH